MNSCRADRDVSQKPQKTVENNGNREKKHHEWANDKGSDKSGFSGRTTLIPKRVYLSENEDSGNSIFEQINDHSAQISFPEKIPVVLKYEMGNFGEMGRNGQFLGERGRNGQFLGEMGMNNRVMA